MDVEAHPASMSIKTEFKRVFFMDVPYKAIEEVQWTRWQ
jgi:hypothetical protein